MPGHAAQPLRSWIANAHLTGMAAASGLAAGGQSVSGLSVSGPQQGRRRRGRLQACHALPAFAAAVHGGHEPDYAWLGHLAMALVVILLMGRSDALALHLYCAVHARLGSWLPELRTIAGTGRSARPLLSTAVPIYLSPDVSMVMRHRGPPVRPAA
jgi:hypothetical protein